jgi:hypothetical protein
MDSSLKLFLIGLAVGISTLLLGSIDDEALWDSPRNYFAKFLHASATSWYIIFPAMIISTLPIVAIQPLRKRFTPKQYLPFPFMAGNGFAFLSLQIIATIVEVVSLE